MRWFRLLAVSLLPFTALAAKKPSNDRFSDFRAKSLSSTPLKLDDAVYNKLTQAPRDYAVAVLLTALETRFGCQLCREFQPEWDLLAKSWTKGDRTGERAGYSLGHWTLLMERILSNRYGISFLTSVISQLI